MKHKTRSRVRLVSIVILLILGSSFVSYQFALASNGSATYTVSPFGFVKAESYIVMVSGSTYYAIDGTTGVELASGTNCTLVVNQAITNLTGGTLFFKDGTYSIERIIIPDSLRNTGLTLEGEAKYRPRINHIGTDEPLIKVENDSNAYYYVTIRNLRFVAGASTGAYPLVNFTNVHRSRLENCWLLGNSKAGHGIFLGGYYTKLEDVYLEAFDRAIWVNANGNVAYATLVRDCKTAYYINADTFRSFSADASLTDECVFNFTQEGDICTIEGSRVEDDAGTATAYCFMSGADNNKIIGGSIANVATKVTDNGQKNRFIEVHGLRTENWGTAEFDSNTSSTFSHGLAGTPDYLFASFNDTGVDGWKWTATISQITITVTPSGTYEVYWYAVYEP